MDLSRNCIRFLIGFPFAGFAIVAKEPMVDGSRLELPKLVFVAAVRYFLFPELSTSKYPVDIQGLGMGSILKCCRC